MIAFVLATIFGGDESPLAPVVHAGVPILQLVGWLAVIVSAACVLVIVAQLAVGFRRSRRL